MVAVSPKTVWNTLGIYQDVSKFFSCIYGSGRDLCSFVRFFFFFLSVSPWSHRDGCTSGKLKTFIFYILGVVTRIRFDTDE